MDYLTEVRKSLQAAADKKAAERKEEARKTRLAKIVLVGVLVGFATFVYFCGIIG